MGNGLCGGYDGEVQKITEHTPRKRQMNKTEKLIKFLKENPECVEKLADALLEEKKEPEPVPWDASMGEHWYVMEGEYREYPYPDSKDAVQPYCFKTKEDAKQMRDYLQVIYKLRIQTKGFVPDWDTDIDNSKFIITYHHVDEELHIYGIYVLNYGSVYFRTREDAKAAADSLTPEEIETFKKGWPVVPMVEKKGDE